MRISYLSSDVCSSDLVFRLRRVGDADEPVFRRSACRDDRPARHSRPEDGGTRHGRADPGPEYRHHPFAGRDPAGRGGIAARYGQGVRPPDRRSEEHTSELQSLMRISYAVFCLKKKKNPTTKPKSHEI